VLVFSNYFDQITDAIAAERQIKGWSRTKKQALIAGNFAVSGKPLTAEAQGLVLRDANLRFAPQDEDRS